MDIEFVGNFLQSKYIKTAKIKLKTIFIFDMFLSTNSDFKYLFASVENLEIPKKYTNDINNDTIKFFVLTLITSS